MINILFSLIRGKKSIQVEMFWAFVFSFIIAVVSMAFISIFNQTYVPTICFIAAFTVSFYLLTGRVVRYLIALADGLDIISEGNLDYRVPILREDELGRVALSINAMTERLDRQIQRERKIEKSKMDLITGVSHDLRTPLTSIIGYLDLLRTSSFQNQNEYERFFQNTYSKAIHLKKLIDDLFEFTRLTSSSIKLNLKQIDVHQLLDQMIFEFEPIALENRASIDKDIGNTAVVTVIDSEKFARAIDNLLMNALKYSIKPGTIRISMKTDEQFFYITVENEGTPITKDQEEKLFDRFYKGDHSRRSEDIQTGTGLGLSITRNIVELHEGTVTLTYNDGIFVFIITVPLRNSLVLSP
ncbi:HAMP domain-containing sensor histidine kinase [Paenibacillus sp. SYP-B3998]|nr:HAMP domain-containing sensor histidine kinase [Paenibacillus sp. SYP-B3998]